VVFGAVSLVVVPGFGAGVSFLQPASIRAATTITVITARTAFLMFTPFHKTISSSISLMHERVTIQTRRQTAAVDAEKPQCGTSLPQPAAKIK
jgi:hypothetical protein